MGCKIMGLRGYCRMGNVVRFWQGEHRVQNRQFLSVAIPLCVRLCYDALVCGKESLCFQTLSAKADIVRLASYVHLIMPGWGLAR